LSTTVLARSVFAELGEDVGRDADRDLRQLFGEDCLGAAFMRRVGVGVQQADRDRFDAIGPQPLGDMPQRVLVERRHLLTGRVEPAAHGVAILAPHQRFRPGAADIVKARPVLPADQQQIPETLIGDEGDMAAAALDHRVGRGRHAVPDINDIAAAAALQRKGALQPVYRAEGAVLRRRRHLGDADPSCRLVVDEVVGKGAADIGGNAQTGRSHACTTTGKRNERKRVGARVMAGEKFARKVIPWRRASIRSCPIRACPPAPMS
jgi:hypothetical protein